MAQLFNNASLFHCLLVLLLAMNVSCTKKNAAQNSPVLDGYVNASGNVQLYYRLIGSGPDTLVIIHGGPGFTMDYFLEDLRPLAASHVLIFYDQRGTGSSTLVSDSASLDAQTFVDDLEALRKHFGLQRMNILGHSWGTAIVALYAINFPDHVGKMVSVGVLPLQGNEFYDAFKRLEERTDSVKLKRMRELYAARLADPANGDLCRQYYTLWFEPFYGDPARPAPSKGDFCVGTPESRGNKMTNVDRFTFASLGDWDWRTSLRKVTAPVLIIHGTNDPLPSNGAHAWKDALDNSELLLLDSIGHFPYIEAPEKFFAAVDKFLKRVDN